MPLLVPIQVQVRVQAEEAAVGESPWEAVGEELEGRASKRSED